MFRYYGALGLTLVKLAFILTIFKIELPKSLLVSLNLIGFWLFFDSVDFKLNHTSILHKIKKLHSLLFYIIIIAVLISLVSEFFGAYISGLWGDLYYRGLAKLPLARQVISFLKGMVIGYGAPFLLAITLYRIILHFVKKEIPKLRFKFNLKKDEKYIFSHIGLIGAIFLIIPLLFFNLSKNWEPVFRGILFGFTLLGFWFLLEYVEYKKHESSLLKDILEFKWRYLIAVIITSLTIALIVEGFNILNPAWQYKNIPLAHISIFGRPVIIIFGWIPLVVIYLSFYRGFLRKRDVTF